MMGLKSILAARLGTKTTSFYWCWLGGFLAYGPQLAEDGYRECCQTEQQWRRACAIPFVTQAAQLAGTQQALNKT